MIVVHHLENSRSQRILWLLEELELPYEVMKYERVGGPAAPDSLKKVHPLGKSPVIVDDQVTLAESGAIIEYILTKYGNNRLQPVAAGWLDNLYFTHYAEGTLMPIVTNKRLFTAMPQRAPLLSRHVATTLFGAVIKNVIDPRLKDHSKFVEDHLARSPTGWFAGGDHPTSADFQMFFALESLDALTTETGPKIKEFLARIHQRPAYIRALRKGGDFSVRAA